MRICYFRTFALTTSAAMLLSGCTLANPHSFAYPGTSAAQGINGSSVSDLRARQSGSTSSLLYVSSSVGNVYTYSYPKGTPVGTLSGFIAPEGECVDSAGDIFITASASPTSTASTIFEYAHGGNSPIATLNDPGHALGCSVDSNTGNLAVANVYDPSNPYNSGYGSVAIYAAAQGDPTLYYSSQFGVLLCGYDDEGNLYLTVSNGQPHEAQLARLANGSSSIDLISLDATLYGSTYFVPSVQWDGRRVTVSSNKGFGNPVFVYRLDVSGRKAKVIGKTVLRSKKDHHGGQSWVGGKRIVGIVYLKGSGGVALWGYPNGGLPNRQIKHILARSMGILSGVVVSTASSKH